MMKLALMTTLASLAAAAASDKAAPQLQHYPKITSLGTEKEDNYASKLFNVAFGLQTEAQPSYCYMPPPNPSCYENSYPVCCTDEEEDCPDDQPGCECEGDCDAVKPCSFPNGDECDSDEFCMIEPGKCRMSGDTPGLCIQKPEVCAANWKPVCGCDDITYGNVCGAAGAGVNILRAGECTNRNRRFGRDYCTWSPDYECFNEGWPQCCLNDDQECPPDRHPRCDNQTGDGWDYCTDAPDESCYSSGWPSCCDRFDGTNCPEDRPNCDQTPTLRSVN